MIKTILKSVREYTLPSFLAPLLVTLEVIMEVIIPRVMADLIDYGITGGNMNEVWKCGIYLILLGAMSLLFGFGSGHYASKASTGFAANLRKDMYYKVQQYDFANIDKFSTASIVTRMTNDVSRVEMAYQMLIRGAVRSPIMLVSALFMAFRVNTQMALIFVAICPVIGIGMYFMMTKAHPIFNKMFKAYDVLNRVVQENLMGIRVVKSFVREDKETEKFKDISGEVAGLSIKAEKIMVFSSPLMQFAIYACMIMLSWLGAHFITASGNNPELGMTTGDLNSLFTYVMQILMSLMMLSMLFVMIVMSRASMERITEILKEENVIKNNEDPAFDVADGSVDFEDVSFSYSGKGGNMCLEDVNLHINSGETVGILGSTGSSKSTLVQLIPRLYDTTEGCVKVGGKDVREYDVATLRNRVSMVLQKNELFSGTIKENLRWGDPDADDSELEEACKMAQAHDFIMQFEKGYDTYIEQGGTNVSGGQKQRLCIARALLKKPAILIFDDSTSAVDTKTDAMIRDALKKALPGTTKFIIAQRVSSVENADKIIVMDGGKISAVGSHSELIESCEIYRQVYESQVRGGSNDE